MLFTRLKNTTLAATTLWVTALATSSFACLSACSGHGDDGHSHAALGGIPSGATCPTGSTITYQNDIAPFMTAYCTRCHSSTLAGDARNGAPLGHDFDTQAGILAVGDHVDEYAAAGPDSVNTIMPPDGTTPTEAERKKLGEWLACSTGGH